MQRRKFLKRAFILPAFTFSKRSLLTVLEACSRSLTFKRVRPTDPGWPSYKKWEKLKLEVNGNLIKIESPLNTCKIDAKGNACKEVFRELRNPYYIGDQPALTQSAGWLYAWTSSPSIYAVAAKTANDVAAAVNFARIHNLRLVVKGGGHSYQGTSNAPDSLLVWTRAMNKIELHDLFVPVGCESNQQPQQAVSIGAGAIWMHVYEAVTAKAGRYVQGGGCATVGVAGLIQSGGFGSYSKKYGLAAAALLEAEIITAKGKILVVNACQNPDLFWGLKGGGGGSLGVITKITLKTRELPTWFGAVSGSIKANSDAAYKKLIERLISFYNEQLFNPHWGEQFKFYADNHAAISMNFQGMESKEAKEIWKSFEDWVNSSPQEYSWQRPLDIVSLPAKYMWDSAILAKYAPSAIVKDDRPNAPSENIFWSGDQEQVGQFWHGYHSVWLPAELLEDSKQKQLVNALFTATRFWTVGLHFNKGLAGAPKEEIAAAKETATNPSVLTAFALAIIAGGDETGPVIPGISGHEPDIQAASHSADHINKAMVALRHIAPGTGSYVSESNFFEPDWQHSFWGTNYSKLSEVKKKYDPDGLFFVHHGVGSEEWSDDGFTRLHSTVA
ncbi:FAD-linked oxidase [Niastella koreensis]|uniref:FAD linked oxidase domain protein n=2 Tax=Niastella koreensis TaxID=354356 RepID=G8TI23_NIAKG|nr:FAD-binding oxidoreductase [Niastella koreensis]AEV99626.1 FAD linked oxidase domain protein [Niastella koreensis GR20-10]OQP49872.1 FAD-linked oxidase [Niastella koreensis]